MADRDATPFTLTRTFTTVDPETGMTVAVGGEILFVVVCPICSALVDQEHGENHRRWHGRVDG